MAPPTPNKAQLGRMRKDELTELCQAYGIPAEGRRSDMQDRLERVILDVLMTGNTVTSSDLPASSEGDTPVTPTPSRIKEDEQPSARRSPAVASPAAASPQAPTYVQSTQVSEGKRSNRIVRASWIVAVAVLYELAAFEFNLEATPFFSAEIKQWGLYLVVLPFLLALFASSDTHSTATGVLTFAVSRSVVYYLNEEMFEGVYSQVPIQRFYATAALAVVFSFWELLAERA